MLTGRAPLSAPAVVHFAAPEVVAEGLRRHADWRRVPVGGARNAFVSTRASRASMEPRVLGAVGPRGREPGRVTDALTPLCVASGLVAAVGLGVAVFLRAP